MTKLKARKQRREFEPAAKLQAVRAVTEGKSLKEVAGRLDIHENLLRRWVAAFRADGAKAFERKREPISPQDEVARLKREVAKLRAERDQLRNPKPVAEKASVTKSMLLDATEQIMVEEGYAAISTRRVAKRVGVTAAAVHYYFPTTNDLLLAAFRRKREYHDERVHAALASATPVRSLWEFYTDQERNAIGIEFRAMVNHRKVIRAELAKDIEESRREQVAGIDRYLRDTKLEGRVPDALCLVMIIAGMGRAFVTEEVLGVNFGHPETKALLEKFLSDLEALAASNAGSRSSLAKIGS